MKHKQPELSDKLLKYQDKYADALASAINQCHHHSLIIYYQHTTGYYIYQTDTGNIQISKKRFSF